MANKGLNSAKKAKKNEFYTRIEDIGNELQHYRDFFRGKSVLCNCDDPYESKFFKFFALHFNDWELRKLVATCYDGSPVAGSQLQLALPPNEEPEVTNILKEPEAVYGRRGDGDSQRPRVAYKIEITEVPDMNGDGATDMTDVNNLIRNRKNVLTTLKGNGDFRSPECLEMLQEADVVVTNPPFSLFRVYVALLMKFNKKFLIIGHQNAITYKEIFPLIKENKMWLGYGFKGAAAHFYSYYEDNATAGDHREGMIRVSGVNWFTNIDHKKRHEFIDLYKEYDCTENPHYESHDAINVNKTADIPLNYDGVMGVPITFMDKFNPEQFEILDCCEPCINLEDYKKTSYFKSYKSRQVIYRGKLCQKTYHRLLIRKTSNKDNNKVSNEDRS